jgi:hypothetical protein
MKALLIALLFVAACPFASANEVRSTSLRDPVTDQLLYRIYALEQSMRDLDARVSYLEGSTNPLPPRTGSVGISCLLVDSGYSKTFLGKASTKLQAESLARQECGKVVNSSYCDGSVRCSNPVRDPNITGYFCTMTDTGYSKIFNGEGTDAIEAEAHAKQACQASVNATYCGETSVRCEGVRR